MGIDISPELAKLGQAIFQQRQDGVLAFDWSNKNLALKLLHTPVSQTSIVGVTGAIVMLVGAKIFDLSWMANAGGVCMALTVLYAMVIPIVRSDLAKSEVQIMYVTFLTMIQKALELPSHPDGAPLIDTITTESLAQPTEETVKISRGGAVDESVSLPKTTVTAGE